MQIFLISFISSLIINIVIIINANKFFPSSLDCDLTGIQKVHFVPVPRIGGLGIFSAILIGFFCFSFVDLATSRFGFLLMFSSLPLFLSGFFEDLTKGISARFRLFSAFFSAVLAGYFLESWITSLHIFGFYSLVLFSPVISIVITSFAVAGVSHSFNIIDGYNGLSSAIGLMIFLGIGYVAFQVSDSQIVIVSLSMVGAILGFLIWNYPRGLIFLGDGGAYFIGFMIAELSVLLTSRHPEVSKWFPFLLCLYPIFETLFTIYRRVVIKRRSPGMPDSTHLHQLIHSRVARFLPGRGSRKCFSGNNFLTAPFLWVLSSAAVIPSILFWQNHLFLIGFSIFFMIFYTFLYWSIVRFATPKWLFLIHKFLTPNSNTF